MKPQSNITRMKSGRIDSKRTHRAKAQTVAMKRARAAKAQIRNGR